MFVKLLAEHHLEFLLLTGDCTGFSESTLVKMPHCWKSFVAVQIFVLLLHPYIVIDLQCQFRKFWEPFSKNKNSEFYGVQEKESIIYVRMLQT